MQIAEIKKLARDILATESLYVDLVAPIGSGDIVETGSGRRYRALAVRVQVRGKNAGRQHLRCIVVDPDSTPAEIVFAGPDGEQRGGEIHRICWYKRESSARGRR